MSEKRQLLNALGIISSVMLGIILLFLGRNLPGELGKIFANIFRILTMPIILEVSFALLGIAIVSTIAYYQTKNDEFVEIEIEDAEEKK